MITMNPSSLIRSSILLLFCLFACQQKPVSQVSTQQESKLNLLVGAENTFAYLPMLHGKRVAVVANQTSMLNEKHLVDHLLGEDVSVSKVFAPEHGFRGKADAGETINDEVDAKTGLPIISLYGKNKKPSQESLSDVDIVVFDIQDVGVRFYTYISTLHYVMEACAESKKKLIVLDRPNPHAHYVDGPMMEEEYKSFVGMHDVPVVYGLTIGEYAKMINGESWLKDGLKCDLEVVYCLNYDRKTVYNLPIKPSPNLPNALAIQLYPSLCFFEGTAVSAGRGTDRPFQCYGHPALDKTYSFTPKSNVGAKYPKFKNELIKGVDLSQHSVNDVFNSSTLNLDFLIDAFANMQDAPSNFFLETNFFEKLAGTKNLRKQILEGKSSEEIKATWQDGLEKYNLVRKKYLAY